MNNPCEAEKAAAAEEAAKQKTKAEAEAAAKREQAEAERAEQERLREENERLRRERAEAKPDNSAKSDFVNELDDNGKISVYVARLLQVEIPPIADPKVYDDVLRLTGLMREINAKYS